MIAKVLRTALQSTCSRCLFSRNLLHQAQKQLSTLKYRSQILSYSSLFVQDGVEINEIPIIVRHIDIFSLGNKTPTETIKESEDDVKFKELLYQCKSVGELLKLLNMPADQVTTHSAAFALQRLVHLQATCEQKLSSFIQTAVLNELCDTATKHIELVPNRTLLDLLRCATNDNFLGTYVDKMRVETEKRIGDSQFTVSEVCYLIYLLTTKPTAGVDVVESLWIHLGNRAQDMDESNLVAVYSMCKLMKSKQKYLLELFHKQLNLCWWKLSSRDITSIASMSMSVKHRSVKVMNLLGRWAFMNVKQINDIDLAQMISAYSNLHYNDKNFMSALERYIADNIWTMNFDIIALAMEYFRQLRYISPRIFDVVAVHIERYSSTYTAQQLLMLIRPYGQLNFEPPNVCGMFDKVEDSLLQHFDDFTAVSLVELLSSFVYIRRLPLNFINKVFNAHFLSEVNVVREPAIKSRMSRQLRQIQNAIKLEMNSCHLPYLFMDTGDQYFWLDEQQYILSQEVKDILERLLGRERFSSVVSIPRTPYYVDFEITINSRGNIASNGSERIAVLIMMPEFYCSSHHHLLGEYVMRQRHLQLLGYKVVQILYTDFMQCKNFIRKSNYIASLLRPHIKNVDVYLDI